MNNSSSTLTHISVSVVAILDNWKLQTNEMQLLLGLPDKFRSRAFQKLRDGQQTLPDDEVVLRRASYLLRIAEALHTMYPRNPSMGGRWIRLKHRRLGGRTPLAMILESKDIDTSLISILSELDCTFAWDMTGSKPMV